MIRNPRLFRLTPGLILLAPLGFLLAGPALTSVNIALLLLALATCVAWSFCLGGDSTSVLAVFALSTLARGGIALWATGAYPASRTPIVLMVLSYLFAELALLVWGQERTTAEVSA